MVPSNRQEASNMPDPLDSLPSEEGASSNRQEETNMPAPSPPADQQVSKEVKETPPQHQEEHSSGKTTTGEVVSRSVGKDTSKPSPPPKAEGKGSSKEVSKSSANPSSTSPEGGKDGSSVSTKGQKSAVSDHSYKISYSKVKTYDNNNDKSKRGNKSYTPITSPYE